MTTIHDVDMLSLKLCEKKVIPEGAYQALVKLMGELDFPLMKHSISY